jgi:hypothetical protein
MCECVCVCVCVRSVLIVMLFKASIVPLLTLLFHGLFRFVNIKYLM